ncbi:MAG: F0F1 ATP synthase subunit A [Alphaproteobacteria bacterium]|nr:F0F1 ATP synthase subunit A [Alphaproteobacteria bacterium]
MSNDPIHQFQIKPIVPLEIGGLDVSLTNSGLYMLGAAAALTVFLTMSMGGRALVPGRVQSVTELIYGFIADMVRSTAGSDGMKFFPLVFTLFVFILFANMVGMFPYAFTFTSHIVITAVMALLVIGIVVFYGFYKHGLHFLGLFVPKGVPWVMLPLLVPIEIFSFLVRPVSLSLRLFANVLAGHITLKVFAGFVATLAAVEAWWGVPAAGLPLLMTVALTALEFLVAFLQAFVFAILTCVYLNDAIHPGH